MAVLTDLTLSWWGGEAVPTDLSVTVSVLLEEVWQPAPTYQCPGVVGVPIPTDLSVRGR